MASPIYQDDGGLVYNLGISIDVPYPAIINANDALIMQIMKYDLTTFTLPIGWIEIDQEQFIGQATLATYIKRATGTESGVLTVATNGTSVDNFGIMCRVSGVITSGTMYEAFNTSFDDLSVIPIPSITTLGDERLAISLFFIAAIDLPISGPTDYTKQYALFNNSGTPGFACVGNTQTRAIAGVVPADSATLPTIRYFSVHTFALLPNQAADNLISKDLITGSIIIQNTIIGQIQKLISDKLITGSIIVQNSIIGQVHILSSQNLTTEKLIIEKSTLTEIGTVDNLTAQDLTTEKLIIEKSVIKQIHILISQILETQNPIISNPSLSESKYNLIAQDLITEKLIIEKSILTEINTVDNLIAQDLETASTFIISAILEQIHNLLSKNLKTENIFIKSPILNKEIHYKPIIRRTIRCKTYPISYKPIIRRNDCS